MKVGKDAADADERAALETYAHLLEQQSEAKARRKAAQEDLNRKIDAKYPKLTEAEIKTLVVDDKWLAQLSAAVQGELDRVSQILTGRIRELAERYATPLPKLIAEVETLSERVDEHLRHMVGVMGLRSGYKRTEAGVIPENWALRPLLTTVSIANGQVDPQVEPYREMTLVAPNHIESGTGRLLSRETASDQKAISGKYLFGRGDIVYSKIRPYLRKAVLAEFNGLCSADMYPLKPAADVSGGFMLSVLLGQRFTRYAESVSVRSGMPKINRTELADFVVALPPLPEQRAIATVLSDVDALLHGLERLIAKKRDLKQAAMQHLLTGQTRLPGFHGEWEV